MDTTRQTTLNGLALVLIVAGATQIGTILTIKTASYEPAASLIAWSPLSMEGGIVAGGSLLILIGVTTALKAEDRRPFGDRSLFEPVDE